MSINTQPADSVRRLSPRDRKHWTRQAARIVSGNSLTVAIVLMLEDCETKETGQIDLSTLDLEPFGLTHRSMVAGCKNLRDCNLIELQKIRPGYWLARLRMPHWETAEWSLLQ